MKKMPTNEFNVCASETSERFWRIEPSSVPEAQRDG